MLDVLAQITSLHMQTVRIKIDKVQLKHLDVIDWDGIERVLKRPNCICGSLLYSGCMILNWTQQKCGYRTDYQLSASV